MVLLHRMQSHSHHMAIGAVEEISLGCVLIKTILHGHALLGSTTSPLPFR